MKFRGREIDPIRLWSEYVEFPQNMKVDANDEFLPLVVCPNPDHQTTKRHFQINVKRDLVHCFANCGISGTYERAISMIEEVGTREARRRILRHSRLGKAEISRRSKRTVEAVSDLDLSDFSYLPPFALEYLDARGISAQSIAAFNLGWDADEARITIPAFDLQGRLRFVIKRAVRPKDHPKYLYPEHSQKERLLFGACQIDLGMVRSKGIVLVEGSLDVIRLHQHGFCNTVGILGNFISDIQARQIANLRPKCVYAMFDKDAAGLWATISAYDRLGETMPIKVCRYPSNRSDPAELSREEAERVIRRAVTWLEFSRVPSVRAAISTRSRRSRRIETVG
jgi:DNA primase